MLFVEWFGVQILWAFRPYQSRRLKSLGESQNPWGVFYTLFHTARWSQDPLHPTHTNRVTGQYPALHTKPALFSAQHHKHSVSLRSLCPWRKELFPRWEVCFGALKVIKMLWKKLSHSLRRERREEKKKKTRRSKKTELVLRGEKKKTKSSDGT